jgi:hypothetical protein
MEHHSPEVGQAFHKLTFFLGMADRNFMMCRSGTTAADRDIMADHLPVFNGAFARLRDVFTPH